MQVQVVVPRHLGDAVLALPALRQLCRVADVLVRADGGAARVLDGQGSWTLAPDRDTPFTPLPTLLLAGSARVALQALRARAPLRVGRATDRRRLLLTHTVPEPDAPLPGRTPLGRRLPAMLPGEHQTDAWLRAARVFARALDLTLTQQQGDDQLHIDSADHAAAAQWIARSGAPTVLLHPWAAGMPTKRWASDRWVQLGERLRASGQTIAVTGGPAIDDAREARVVAARLGVPVAAGDGTLPPRVWAAAARRMHKVVLPDTGLAHVAAAAGASSVVLFGATDPVRHAPRGPGASRLLQISELACGPCYRADCRGPIQHACLAHQPARVAQEVLA